jgi:hypothetical protein
MLVVTFAPSFGKAKASSAYSFFSTTTCREHNQSNKEYATHSQVRGNSLKQGAHKTVV